MIFPYIDIVGKKSLCGVRQDNDDYHIRLNLISSMTNFRFPFVRFYSMKR